MEYCLKNKVAIVTGGSGGLGKAIVQLLMQEDAHVAITYRSNKNEIEKWIDELNKKYNARSVAIYADIAKEEDLENVFDKVVQEFGRVDILVNNAGIWPTSYVKDMSVEDFRQTLDTNLIAPFVLSKRLVNYLMEQNRGGKIINIVSQAAFHGSTSGHAHYAASKGGLVSFMVSLAREVAPYGICVNAVAPGIMESPMNSEVLKDPVRKERYLERIPLRRIAQPMDVAKIVAFLASNQADYITGATIDATGGMLMR